MGRDKGIQVQSISTKATISGEYVELQAFQASLGLAVRVQWTKDEFMDQLITLPVCHNVNEEVPNAFATKYLIGLL